MSEELHIWPEIQAICAKAGLEPNDVEDITITPTGITFSVFDRPLRMGSNRRPVGVWLTRPWTREP